MTNASTESWARRISRAESLTADDGPAGSLLRFYTALLREQRKIHDALDSKRAAGAIDADVRIVLERGSDLFKVVSENGPDQLAAEARALMDSPEAARERQLLTYWRVRSDRAFFAKALLQPYAEWLTSRSSGAISGASGTGDNRCPRCGGAPQLSVLQGVTSISGDGSSRHLQCATCLTRWAFRRVVCPSCGNEDEATLGSYRSPAFPHMRVDACERCGRYLKTIDLDRLGVAVPLVDEVAGAPLDLWAQEHGFHKIELNLVGL